MALDKTLTLLTLVAAASAQYGGGGGYGGYGGGGGYGGYGGGGSSGGYNFYGFNFTQYQVILTAHAVLATVAFALLFPLGGILIRLATFRGVWLVHGLFQVFAYLLYIAAFGIGIWMVQQRDGLINNVHPIIGIILFVVLFFQPFLGLFHHLRFKKTYKRGVFSYGHIWIGRIAITLGIINGGLGLRYARELGMGWPSRGRLIAYGVVAGFIWLLYVFSILIGERRRRKVREVTPPAYKEGGSQADAESTTRSV